MIVYVDMNWTKEWPTEPGWYWFYGYDFGEKHGFPKRLISVTVNKITNGFSCVGDGHFMYPSEAEGLWCSAVLPTLPEDIEFDEIRS